MTRHANNALVRQAQEEGGLAVGYTCYHMPKVRQWMVLCPN